MNIEKEITKYYNEQFEKHKPALIDLLSSFLGEEHRELIKEKVNSLDIIYFVTRRDLSLALKNDDLDENEQKMLEIFLEKILNYNPLDLEKMTVEELIAYVEKIHDFLSPTGKELFATVKNAFLLAKEGDLINTTTMKELKEILKTLIKKVQLISLYHYIIGTYGAPKELESFKYQACGLRITYKNQEKGVATLPIYPRDLSPDGKFLWAVLNYVIDSLKKEDIDIWHDSINLGERLNIRITDYLSIILAHKLHKNGTYIFDNKDLSKIEKKYERLLESEVYQKIKLYFGGLFTKYLIEPKKVIELVGKDNFHQFALWISYLASNLEDEMDYYEEYENSIGMKIPYEDLDIDIMEVLDDMYLEYLRHQTISLTTIDIKTILQAKKVMDAKKEYARIETEHDSKCYHLTLLFKYLEKYGNCCIRFSSQDKLCHMLEFKIAENGELKVTKYIELYDRPPFNYEKTLNPKAKLKDSIKEGEYSENEFNIALSCVLYSSLYHETAISTNRDLRPVTISEISTLYEKVLPMFNLSLKELIEWVLSNNAGSLNILSKPREYTAENYSFETIELKMQTLKDKIKEVRNIYNKVDNARNK